MDGLISGGGGLKPGGLKSGILRYSYISSYKSIIINNNNNNNNNYNNNNNEK